jgi:hypothetical protein
MPMRDSRMLDVVMVACHMLDTGWLLGGCLFAFESKDDRSTAQSIYLTLP